MLHYLPLVRRIALRLRPVAPEAEFDELISVGTIGLIEAIDRYDPDRGCHSQISPTSGSRARSSTKVGGKSGARLGSNLVSLHQTTVGDAGSEADIELVDLSTDLDFARTIGARGAERAPDCGEPPAIARERGIVVLHVKGFTVAEIADPEGCSRSRASQLLTQAHLRLEEATAA